MGVTSLVLGIAGLCFCWVPYIGWLGVLMGVVACALGVPSITNWYERPGYTGWGTAGITLGSVTVIMGIAYGIKHAAAALDVVYYPLHTPTSFYIVGVSVGLIIGGLLLARLKSRSFGVVIAYLALAVFFVTGSWALTTADRAFQQSEAEQADAH
ncbi:MAG: hypothetical protein GY847_28190 [Proteobacteria bacterium]|nr:hypothetical protein [Pseudomonadota bacterium]